ncbi:MAG: hypothetical protein JXX28_11225 [Deltaproteobacteria bacterium]|nr:hypothetical protein [Deltaproteobacteria bacterium]
MVPSLLTGLAWASESAHSEATGLNMSAIVTLILGIAAAYLLTHFVIEAIQRRFLFRSGIEYLILGIFLGPMGLGVGVFDDLTPVAPFVALAAGWVGLLAGMGFNLRTLVHSEDISPRLSLLESAGSGLAVAVAAHFVLRSGWLGTFDADHAWLAAGAMGATAAAGSSSAVELVSTRYGLTGGVAGILHRASALSDFLAIAVFGLLFCVFHEAPTQYSRPLTPTEWAVVTVGVGVVLGLTYSLMIGEDDSENNRFLSLVGIIAFSSGAAWFLSLSPLLVSLALGVVLVNTAKRGGEIRDTLIRTARPMSLVLMVFAGALWTPPDDVLATIVITAGALLMRFAGKALGGWAGVAGTPLPRTVARGLLAQGDVAVAMAISFRLVYDGAAIDMAYTAILASVILNEMIAPRALKGLLVDVGQIRTELQPTKEG